MGPRRLPVLLLVLASCSSARPPPAPVEPPRAAEAPPAPAPAPDLPPPLPPPAAEELQPLVHAEPIDPLELLWSHRLEFANGTPIVTIRLMEGQQEIAFRPRAAGRLRPRGAPAVEVPAGEVLRVRARDALPAALSRFPLLAQLEFRDRAGLEAARRTWEGRGVRTRLRLVGGVYGIAGRVIDNRRLLLLAEGDGSAAWARSFAEEAFRRWGERISVFTELLTRPSGTLEVLDGAGARIASGDTVVSLEVSGNAGFVVSAVEHDVGYAAHGFEDRAFRGRLYLTLDASGRLAAVHGIGLEELLRGLVPSEMPPGAPAEALKAQAVTARSNVLAEVGTRHLSDPYVLCSEVHCQAYRGESAEVASTDAAVRSTAGEALFGRADRALVNAVYSAVCGGHGEDNEAVWGDLPDPNLRGRPDLAPGEGAGRNGGLSDPERLRAFVDAAPPAYCGRRKNFRWERRFSRAEVDAIAAPLGVGTVAALEIPSRGVSGRARVLRISGSQGTAFVRGELEIRRLFRNLPSAMFLAERDGAGWTFRGGGWGHGVGMCQWGAVGRAEARQDYRQILRHYYGGAEVARIY